MLAGASAKSTMITVAVTSPNTFERSLIRGHPPIDTSPRPSATGNLHSARASIIGVGVGVGVGVPPTAPIGSPIAVGFVGAGFLIVTPLFQTVFDPVLIQVNFLPAAMVVVPSLEHFAPAFGVAAMVGVIVGKSITSTSIKNTCLLMLKA